MASFLTTECPELNGLHGGPSQHCVQMAKQELVFLGPLGLIMDLRVPSSSTRTFRDPWDPHGQGQGQEEPHSAGLPREHMDSSGDLPPFSRGVF